MFLLSRFACPLPIKSLTSVLKASKISGHFLLKHSHDPIVSSCTPKLKPGCWEVEKAVNVTEQDIKLQQMTGYHYQGCHGIEYINNPKAPEEKSSKHCRDFISRSFKEIDETYNISKAVQLLLQGRWTRWLSFIQQDFSWKCLLASPINLISFCLSSTFLIPYHHQVTSNAEESPLKLPVFCATKPIAQLYTFQGHIVLLSNKATLLMAMHCPIFLLP